MRTLAMRAPRGAMLSVCLALAAASAASAQSIVDLRLAGPASPIIPGQIFEVTLRAERQSATSAASFIAIDCIVGWNPADLRFLGITTAGSVPLSQSYLPSAATDYTGINELDVPADGNLLYYALAPLGQPRQVTAGGVQIVTFRFESISTFTQTRVDIIDNLEVLYPTETIVYDGVTPGIDDFGIGHAAIIDQLDCNTIFWYRDADGDGAGDPALSTTGCTQPTGYVSSSNDLCPANGALIAPVAYYADLDADGFGDAASSQEFCETAAPSGFVANATDCDDAAVMYGDADLDGYGGSAMIACGGVASDTDCNDGDALVHPGAPEVCANLAVDNDCDGDVSDAEASDSVAYFVDADQDGFGAGAATPSCSAVSGSVTNATDCDDAAPDVYPGALERCADLAVDNDCDGLTLESEAIDPVEFYLDADQDGAGDPANTAFACIAPAGYVANADDGCPQTQARTAPIAWYEDADADGVGDAAVSTLACDQPVGFTAAAGDLCPSDGQKLEPGACGCGAPDTDADQDGNPDCFGQVAALSLVADQPIYAAGEQILVRIDLGPSGVGLRSADLSIVFDATRLSLVGTSVAAGSPFTQVNSEAIDNIGGTLRTSISIPSSAAASDAGTPLLVLAFDVASGPAICQAGGLVQFGTVAGSASALGTTTSVPMVPTVAPMAAVSVLSTPPTLAQVPADVTVAADAGTLLGAFLSQPSVAATDGCGASAAVSIELVYPDSSTGGGWPVDGMFPIGTTTVTWIATDSVLQTSTVSRAVTVTDRQLIDVQVSYLGAFGPTSTRSIRVSGGGVPTVREVTVTSGSAVIEAVEVPASDTFGCVMVKDSSHSISTTSTPTVVGTRYGASVTLRQGDSNDDNLIDILDFSIFISDRGPDATRGARSNFNADPVVSNADFTYIALGFLNSGTTCGGLDGPGQPRDRISVKELRRRGLGELVKADLNHDGWVDMYDIALFMQGGS